MNPNKFLMCYEVTIASAGGDEATLAKSLIISLEDAVANWYSRLPSGCIYSWQQLNMKDDFISCAQREKETLPNFYRRFLQLKAKALEVSDK
jgi:hypothetical protein